MSLQETFVALSKDRSSNWLEGLLASHPPSQERVTRNRQTAARLSETVTINLTQGFDRYRANLSRLGELSPAYDLTTDALNALNANDLNQATIFIHEALRLTDSEAAIHGAAGQISLALKKPREAESHFSAAIKINETYFRYYLGRGFAHKALGQFESARKDLEASQRLFQTEAANRALNEL